ncbi:unnamed protein product [Blepharisma stoltei]|uniref:Uncharacterized protein n=1 Tax=Blepharisma stoltei TaxID=1481888 RepID=A0AAU9JX04_9CILI|nr:unnamed protein product [Blepharisma stoltei]
MSTLSVFSSIMSKFMDSQILEEGNYSNLDNNKHAWYRSRDFTNEEESEPAKYQKLTDENESLRNIMNQKDSELKECYKRIDTLEKWMQNEIVELNKKIKDLSSNEGEELAPLLEQFKVGLIERDEDIQERLFLLEEEVFSSKNLSSNDKENKKPIAKTADSEECKKTILNSTEEEPSSSRRKRPTPGEKSKRTKAKPRRPARSRRLKPIISDDDLSDVSSEEESEDSFPAPKKTKKKMPANGEKNKKVKEKPIEEQKTDVSKGKIPDEEPPKKKPIKRPNESVELIEECTEEDWNKAAWSRILKK